MNTYILTYIIYDNDESVKVQDIVKADSFEVDDLKGAAFFVGEEITDYYPQGWLSIRKEE